MNGSKYKEFASLTTLQFTLLVTSGMSTTLSWIFYYRAMKDGLVSYLAADDKAIILITLLLSSFLLKEPITQKIMAGAGLFPWRLLQRVITYETEVKGKGVTRTCI